MTNENKLLGTVGALIGALLGIAIWCVIGALGRIAWIGGFAICGGAFYGYFILGKGISKAGVAIIAAIVLVSVYLATRMNYALVIHKYTEYSLVQCFGMVEKLVDELNVRADYTKDLVIGYVFTALAALSVFRKAAKGR